MRDFVRHQVWQRCQEQQRQHRQQMEAHETEPPAADGGVRNSTTSSRWRRTKRASCRRSNSSRGTRSCARSNRGGTRTRGRLPPDRILYLIRFIIIVCGGDEYVPTYCRGSVRSSALEGVHRLPKTLNPTP